MEAGRELDALVAEKVMQFDHKHKINGCEEDCWYDVCEYCGLEFHCEDTSGRCEGYPHYSTDIAAAWQVVDRIAQLVIADENAERLNYLRLEQNDSSGYSATFGFPYMENEEWANTANQYDCSARADSAPLAICLAALKAVGVEVE